MTKKTTLSATDATDDLLAFAQGLVRIKSYSGQEEQAARFIESKMRSLDYDEVRIDRYGNVIGKVGSGPQVILFDAHMDTVRVDDESSWAVPPFSGEVKDGWLWGRGSVDMKSGLAAAVNAAGLAKRRWCVIREDRVRDLHGDRRGLRWGGAQADIKRQPSQA